MKRKRLLALFLALSMAFDSGSFTALAADAGANENIASVVNEIDMIEEAESGEAAADMTDKTENGEAGNGIADENGEAESGTSDESGDTENKSPDEAGSGDTENKTPGENGDADVENPDGDDEKKDGELTEGDAGEDSGLETETPEEDSELEPEAPEIIGEAEDESLEESENPEDSLAQKAEIRTFTDETGMVIAYDASTEYQYTVTAGVLTDIKTSSGEAVSGTVVLSSSKGIRVIGENAFQGNVAVTYVKLPSGVESIEQNAFKGCEKLAGITLPSGMKTVGNGAFENCPALTQLSIPKTVTVIGSRAFYNDGSLFMVYMKDAAYSELQTIGASAFYGCTALIEFCSDTNFVFPGALQEIGASAFEGCSSIQKIVLPNNITTLGKRVFYECIALTDVTLSKEMQTIPAYAFYGCRNLVSINFVAGNKIIEEHAFEDCQRLGSVTLPLTVTEIQSYAFKGCTGLRRVEIQGNPVFGEDGTFPNSGDLCMIGQPETSVEDYAAMHNIRFVSYETGSGEFYKCETLPEKYSPSDNIYIYIYDDLLDKKANDQNKGKGVVEGTELYVSIANSSKLTEGSLRCNGVPIVKNSKGDYVFKMPKGGALITAKFEGAGGSTSIIGSADKIKYEFSNGEMLPAGNGVELKVGQTTRLFLVDTADRNSVIASSKIQFSSNNTTVATVSSSGMIKALKKGSATITTTVNGSDSKPITKKLYIDVVTTDVETLKLRISSDNRFVDIDQVGGVQRLSIDKTALNEKPLTFEAVATAYDAEDDNLAVALKWTSSDQTVAKLAKASTPDTQSSNTVTIPGNAGGDATITVTATNSDKTVVTGKFIVSVKDYTPILLSSKLNLNPNQENGTDLAIIGAYGKTIDTTTAENVKICDKNGNEDFLAEYDRTSSTGTIARFRIKPSHTIGDGTRSVYVELTMGDVDYKIPLQIIVKKSYPNPKVAFDKKQPKINLFYANDGTEIKPVITNLGGAKISEYSLKPLATDKDEMFTENFTIDSEGVITQKSETILPYTHNKKPALTGYLVLKFEGYKNGRDDYTKSYKITVPTQTVKPSYSLEKTSGTFNANGSATVSLKVIDKKTKEQLVLDDGNYEITNLDGSVVSRKQYSINEDGEIELTIPKGQSKGKFKFSVRNMEWAEKSAYTFNYTINVSEKDPTISLKSATVKLNKKYPEQPAFFTLSSNQLGTQLAPEQEFIAQAPRGKEEEYEKIRISCDENGNGQVEFLDSDIAKGTYKYTCTVQGISSSGYDMSLNKVTLSVKVEDTAPTVTSKGSLSLNKMAVESEICELALTYKNLPEAYTIEELETIESIRCTTKDAAGLEDSFSWKIEDNKLQIGLLDLRPAAKTYSFTMTPAFSGPSGVIAAKAVNFNIKVHNGAISVKLTAKGKVNLLDRGSEKYTQKNSIICTPTIANLKDAIEEAKLYDVTSQAVEYEDEESEYFDVTLLDGKLYVRPKADAEIKNGKEYKVRVWIKLANYSFEGNGGGTWCTKDLTIKTAQTLPKVTMDRSSLKLYTAHKDYDAVFIVKPKAGSVGNISGISFGEKDEKSQDSFDLSYTLLDDGSMEVGMKLKTPSYPCNKANKIKMYVEFEGQGINTKGTAITMNVTIVSRN